MVVIMPCHISHFKFHTDGLVLFHTFRSFLRQMLHSRSLFENKFVIYQMVTESTSSYHFFMVVFSVHSSNWHKTLVRLFSYSLIYIVKKYFRFQCIRLRCRKAWKTGYCIKPEDCIKRNKLYSRQQISASRLHCDSLLQKGAFSFFGLSFIGYQDILYRIIHCFRYNWNLATPYNKHTFVTQKQINWAFKILTAEPLKFKQAPI